MKIILPVFIKKQFKALGLIEILISMAIFAFAIIIITSLNAKNFKQIKSNEITDVANKLMLSTLEFMKSPTTNTASGVVGAGVQQLIESVYAAHPGRTDICFSLISRMDENNFTLNDQTLNCTDGLSSNSALRLNNCILGNNYRVLANSPSLSGLMICNQVVVRKDSTQKGYFIVSRVVYTTPNSNFNTPNPVVINELFGFRPYTYEE
jgi:hypothetical protein